MSKLPERMFGSAAISPCGLYRYELTRSWDVTKQVLAFVMLNPSTADAVENDPTIRRCIGFAEAWGFGELRIYNLFALRSPDPEAVWAHAEPFGPDFDKYAGHLKACDKIVVAWGSSGPKGLVAARGRVFASKFLSGRPRWALALNADGQPRHPLYVRADQQLTRWEVV